jgi:hypothetical protein
MKILQDRYNPFAYRQTTAPPKPQTGERVLQRFDDLTVYDRQYLDTNHELVKGALLSPIAVGSTPGISLAEFRALLARPKKSNQTPKPTCFDNGADVAVDMDAFEAWMVSQPPGTELQVKIDGRVIPIQVGEPTTPQGHEMVKVPAQWAVSEAVTSTCDAEGWVTCDVYAHPSRWTPSPGKLLPHNQAVIQTGYVLTTKKPLHEYKFACSVLFAQLQNDAPEFREIKRVAETLRTKLRLIRPPTVTRVFEGIMLPGGRTPAGEYRLNKQATFRAVRPDKSVRTVTVGPAP